MQILKNLELSRREMLQRSAEVAVMGSAASYALGLAGIANASALTDDGSYKALVCIFLTGGNDHVNTVVPFDPINHALYQNIRRDLAYSRESLSGTALNIPEDQRLTNDIRYALAPSLGRLRNRFNEGRMAILLNVGPLVAPLTKAQYLSSNHTANPRPSKLFSHNDQQSTWQTFQPEGATIGWGGRIADAAQAANQNAMFSSISATGNAVFLSGQSAIPYRITGNGVRIPAAISGTRLFQSRVASTALKTIVGQHHQHVFEQDYARVTDRALRYGAFVNDATSGVTMSTTFPTNNPLAVQLGSVARMIAARKQLGVRRQVFMVSLGGFDHHRGLNTSHPALLASLDEALDLFYQATVELGVAHQVTSFTASDFGRTLSVNGDGTDHGWGSHHMILGGAVNGGRFYGQAPLISLTSDDQVGQGRLLPTTSVDEYSTTLALWMGIAPSDLALVAPNIGRYARPDLGFMARPTP